MFSKTSTSGVFGDNREYCGLPLVTYGSPGVAAFCHDPMQPMVTDSIPVFFLQPRTECLHLIDRGKHFLSCRLDRWPQPPHNTVIVIANCHLYSSFAGEKGLWESFEIALAVLDTQLGEVFGMLNSVPCKSDLFDNIEIDTTFR